MLTTLSIGDVTMPEGNGGVTPFIFDVNLDEAIGQDVTFRFSTIDVSAAAGSDFIATSGLARIEAGQTSTTIQVDVIAGNDVEFDEQLFVELSDLDAGGLDVEFHPDQVTSVVFRQLGSFSLPQGSLGIELVGNTAYMVDVVSGLHVLDVSDPVNVEELGQINVPGDQLQVVDNTAYVAAGLAGLQVLNVADPANINSLGMFDTPGDARSVQVIGNTAYVADGSSGLRVFDIADPGNINELGFFDTPGFAEDIQVVGDRAYVADSESGLRVLDVSDPANILELGFFERISAAYGAVDVLGHTVLVANTSSSDVDLLDVSDLTDITLIGNSFDFQFGSLTTAITRVEDRAYVTGRGNLSPFGTLRVLGLREPFGLVDLGVVQIPNGTDVSVAGNTVYVATEFGLQILDMVPNTAQATATIQNDDIALSVSDASISENGSGTLLFDLTLNQAIGEDLLFDFATVADSATPGNDYVEFSGSGMILAGELSTTVGVEILGDTIVEFDEDFFLEISNLRAGTIDVQLAREDLVRGTIKNDDFATLSFANATISEGDDGTTFLTFDATLDRAISEDATFNISTVDDTATGGVDFTIVNNSSGLISAGATSTSITVEVMGDTMVEPDEQFFVELSNLSANGLDIQFDREITLVNRGVAVRERGVFDTPGLANDVVVVGTTAYVADNHRGLRVLDLRDPSNIIELGTFEMETFFAVLNLQVVGDIAYLAASTSGLRIVDVSDPTNITELGFFETAGAVVDVQVIDNTAYIADGTGDLGFLALDVSDPANITVLGAFESPKSVRSVKVVGSVAYLAENFSLRTLDIRDLSAPVELDVLSTPGFSRHFQIIGDILYLAGETGDVQIVDLRDPTNLRVIGFFPDNNDGSDRAYDVEVVDGIGYVASFGRGLKVYDVTDPTNVTTLGILETPGIAVGITVVDDIVFLADHSEGLRVMELVPNIARVVGTIENDDIPPAMLSLSDDSMTEGDAGVTTFTFDVSLNRAVGQDVTFDFRTVEDSALAGSDFTELSGQGTILAGQTMTTITVEVTGDTDIELDERFFVELSNLDAMGSDVEFADGEAMLRGVGTIEDDDAPTILRMNNVRIVEGHAGSTLFIYTVSLDSIIDQDVTFDFRTVEDSALDGSDFTGVIGQGMILAGETTTTINVEVTGDTDVERDERFFVELSNLDAMDGNVEFAGGGSLLTRIGIIENDDLAEVSIANVTMLEGDSGPTAFVFTVTLSQAVSEDVTFDFSTVADTAEIGTDFIAVSDSRMIPAGQTSTTIRVDVVGNTAVESTEEFFVDLSNLDAGGLDVQFDSAQINMVSLSELGTFETERSPSAIDVVGNKVYVLPSFGDLQVLEVNNPLNITELGSFETSGGDVFVDGTTAYVADHFGGVRILDVSDSENITELGSFTTRGSAHGVQVIGNTAYVAQGTQNEPMGLQILDVSDPAHITELGFFSTDDLARNVEVVGNIAYLAAEESGLHLLDVSNPAQIVELGLFRPTSESITNVEIAGNTVFVIDSDRVYALDVSFPEFITEFGTFFIGGGLTDIQLVDDLLYVTRFSFSEDGLAVLNVTDPANMTSLATSGAPSRLGRLDFVNGTMYATEGNDLVVFRPDLVARAVGTIENDDTSLTILNAQWEEDRGRLNFHVRLSQPISEDVTFEFATVDGTAIGGSDFSTANDTGIIPAGQLSTTVTIQVAIDNEVEFDEHLFVELFNLDAGGVDVKFDPEKLTRVNVSELGLFDTTGFAGNVELRENTAYVADGDSGLRVLDVSDPANINELGGFDTPGSATDVELLGSIAYVADGDSGLRVLDVSDPANIRELGSFDTPGSAIDVELLGSIAYVADGGSGLRVFDVQNPANIRELGFFATPGNAMDVELLGGVTYIADGDSGLRVLDTNDPANIRELGFFDTSGSAREVELVGNIAYVADGNNGLQVLDVSDFSNISELGSFSTQSSTNQVTLLGNIAYVGEESGTLRVLDVIDPTNISELGLIDTLNSVADVKLSGNLAYVTDGLSGIRLLSLGSVAQSTGTIQNDDSTIMSISNGTLVEGDSGNSTYTFHVSLDRAISEDVTFDFATVGDSAVAGTDFIAVNDSRVIPAGESRITVSVEVIGDSEVESDEQFFVELSNIQANGLEVRFQTAQLDRVVVSELDVFDTQAAYNVQVDGTIAYVADGFDGLRVLDVSDPTNIRQLGSLDPVTNFVAQDVEVVDGIAFVGGGNRAGLSVIDVSDPANLTQLRFYSSPEVHDVQIVGTTLYTALVGGLGLLDVGDPSNITELGFIANERTFYDAYAVHVVDHIAYLANSVEGLRVLNVSDPANITELGTFDTSFSSNITRDVQVIGNLAYIVDEGVGFDLQSGLRVLDVSDPTNIQQLGFFDTVRPFAVEVVGTIAYVADRSSLLVLDVSDPSNIRCLGSSGLSPNVRGVDVVGNTVFVADASSGVRTLDLDPVLRAVGTIENDDPTSQTDENNITVRAPGPNTLGVVQVVNAITQEALYSIEPYPGFTGGVRVATGDVNGDGTPDIITGAGPGGGPHVRVFDGLTGIQLPGPIGSFMAYPENGGFFGGIFVAAADITGPSGIPDGLADIITGADAGGGPHVRVFRGNDQSEVFSFFAYNPAFTGGVRVAAGDINGDSIPDIITGAGVGGGPHVRVFDGSMPQITIDTINIPESLGSFFAYDSAFTGGVFVAAGDVNGDGRVDLITGAGVGGGPHVRVFDGQTGTTPVMQLPGVIGSFFAYESGFSGGVRVAASDLNGDRKADILTAAGPGGGPHVRAFDGDSMGIEPEELRSVFVADSNFTGGIFVASSTDFLPTLPLRLADGFGITGESPVLTLAEAQPIFHTALDRLQSAGTPSETVEALRSLTLHVSDLAGHLLGEVVPGSILLDVNAAGVGWYLDPTPETDEEFATGQAIDPRAVDRIDLLTVILHELGHHLGGQDLNAATYPDHFLAATLDPGVRRLPRFEDLDTLFSDADLLESVIG